MPPQDPKAPLDPKSVLLPKEEHGLSVDSAERTPAGVLLKQEEAAATASIGEVTMPHAPAPQPPRDESVVKAIETYGGDINRVVREGSVSVASIAAAEAERRAGATAGEPVAPQPLNPREDTPSPMRPVLIIAGAILLLCTLGVVAALVLRPGPVAVRGQGGQAPFVEVDQTALVTIPADATHASLMSMLDAARQKVNLSVGLVEWLYIATSSNPAQQLPAQQFLTLLAPDLPQNLLRTIEPQYLLGVHSFDENQAFLLLRVDSYQQAYAGMLAWEPTMRRDLLPLFERTPPAHANGTSTTTPEPELLNTGFTDQVVDNHDARVITNSTGDLLLLWTFLDRNTLVIATNEYTLSEVIRRANTSSLVPQP